MSKANWKEVRVGDWTVLVSYSTPVAAFRLVLDDSGPAPYGCYSVLRTNTYYSVTTSKHINAFLRRYELHQIKSLPATPEQLASLLI